MVSDVVGVMFVTCGSAITATSSSLSGSDDPTIVMDADTAVPVKAGVWLSVALTTILYVPAGILEVSMR